MIRRNGDTGTRQICKSYSVMKAVSLPLRRSVLTVLTAHSLQSQNSTTTAKNLRYFRGPLTSPRTICMTPRFAPEKHPSLHLLCCSLLFLLLLTYYCLLPAPVSASDKWQGVDESVVEKYAKEHGREAVKPLINIEQGDLPLFLFLLAGTAGGFAAGYYWRKLTEPGDGNKTKGAKEGPQK